MKSNNVFGKLFDAFPPPKFLDLPFFGLHISDLSIRAIKFTKGDDMLVIEKYKSVPIPPRIITSGQIENKEELIKILQELKKDLGIVYARVSLPEEKAYLFTAKIPIVKEVEVRSAIESKIEENVPVSPTELVFDYKLFDHRQKDHLDVVVSTLPIAIVDQYVEILEAADISPLSLEIESQAIVRSLIQPDTASTTLIVNFSPEKVGLYVESYRVIRFTSTIPTKGEVASNPSFLLQEIKKLFTYWHTLKENVDKPKFKISQVIICGESFDESIVSYLSSHLETPVLLGNVWVNAFDINSFVPSIEFNESLKYAGAIGLALPDDILI